MKARLAFRVAALAAATLLGASCASRPAPPPPEAGAPPPAPAGAERAHAADPAADLSSMMSGTWQGVTPGNDLSVSIEPVVIRNLNHPYDLFLQIRGRFENDNVAQQGYLHVYNQGSSVGLGYIPHFDPTVSGLSSRAARFSASEVNAACSLYVRPSGDGYAGDTRGGVTCAFAIRGAIGPWMLRVEPGTLAVQNERTGETLRFRKTGS